MNISRFVAFTPFIMLVASLMICYPVLAQDDDDFDDFDPSLFEDAGSGLKAFCTNKVLRQSPAPLISLSYDVQGSATVSSPALGGFTQESVPFGNAMGFRFLSNIPVISKNNILVNWGLSYVHLGYNQQNDNLLQHPLNVNMSNHALKWLNTNLTLFKPLNEKRFVLLQVAGELNGDYTFDNMPSLSNIRMPGALIYGFKPNDRLMWGVGMSRTYLGGSLNYIPAIYYFHTFKNDKWGIESVFPGRLYTRYRIDGRNLFMLGYSAEGATYRLSNFNNTAGASVINPSNNIELRRSELRLGLTYARGLSDFLWLNVQAGYRINYEFSLDQGEFYRGFDDANFFLEPGLTNTWFLQFTFNMVSP